MAALGPLHFHMSFIINLSIFTKETARIFTGIALNLEVNLGRADIDTLQVSPFRFSFICPSSILYPSCVQIFHIFVRFIPEYFIFLDALVSGIFKG